VMELDAHRKATWWRSGTRSTRTTYSMVRRR
jgi:hypothetical protein